MVEEGMVAVFLVVQLFQFYKCQLFELEPISESPTQQLYRDIFEYIPKTGTLSVPEMALKMALSGLLGVVETYA